MVHVLHHRTIVELNRTICQEPSDRPLSDHISAWSEKLGVGRPPLGILPRSSREIHSCSNRRDLARDVLARSRGPYDYHALAS
jgi:hypothetical protein